MFIDLYRLNPYQWYHLFPGNQYGPNNASKQQDTHHLER